MSDSGAVEREFLPLLETGRAGEAVELLDDHYAMGNVLAGSVKGLVNLVRSRR